MRRLTMRDHALANKIMGHKDVWPWMRDDYCPKNYGPEFANLFLSNKDITVLHPGKHIIFAVFRRTMTLHEVHTMITPKGRGRDAIKKAREAAAWMFSETSCEKLITYVPLFNPQARLFARLVGMTDEGICTKSFRRDGELIDQWVLGLEKEKFQCQ